MSWVSLERKGQAAPGDQRRAHEFAVMEATIMKIPGVISTTALFLLLGAAVPTFAQEEHHEQEAKPAKQEQQAKPAQHEEQAKPARQEAQAKPVQREAQPKSAEQRTQAKPG